MSVASWLKDRRVDFGIMDVAEGKRPAIVRDDKDLQNAADQRLRELQSNFVGSTVQARGMPAATA